MIKQRKDRFQEVKSYGHSGMIIRLDLNDEYALAGLHMRIWAQIEQSRKINGECPSEESVTIDMETAMKISIFLSKCIMVEPLEASSLFEEVEDEKKYEE